MTDKQLDPTTISHRLCGHAWTTNDGRPGSNHMCGLEHGHAGSLHECASCHETVTVNGVVAS